MPDALIAETAVSLLGIDCRSSWHAVRTPSKASFLASSSNLRPVRRSAAVLEWASREKLCVLVRGSGTKLGWGPAPRQIDILISTARLNAVVAHRHGDLTATIQAGATLGDVNRALATASPVDSARSSIRRSRDNRRHRGHQRQRTAAASIRIATRLDHRRRVRASRRTSCQGRRHRRQERRRLRSAAAADGIVRQSRRHRDRDLQAVSAHRGIADARRRAVEPVRSRRAGLEAVGEPPDADRARVRDASAAPASSGSNRSRHRSLNNPRPQRS